MRDGHWEVTLFVVMSTCKYAFKTDSKVKAVKDNNLITYGYSYQLRNSRLYQQLSVLHLTGCGCEGEGWSCRGVAVRGDSQALEFWEGCEVVGAHMANAVVFKVPIVAAEIE